MSSLSRTYARASQREQGMMRRFQPAGAYQAAERQYNEARLATKAKREAAKARDGQ